MKKTEHINIPHHCVRECVETNVVAKKFVVSNDSVTDGFTKPMLRTKFEELRAKLENSIPKLPGNFQKCPSVISGKRFRRSDTASNHS